MIRTYRHSVRLECVSVWTYFLFRVSAEYPTLSTICSPRYVLRFSSLLHSLQLCRVLPFSVKCYCHLCYFPSVRFLTDPPALETDISSSCHVVRVQVTDNTSNSKMLKKTERTCGEDGNYFRETRIVTNVVTRYLMTNYDFLNDVVTSNFFRVDKARY